MNEQHKTMIKLLTIAAYKGGWKIGVMCDAPKGSTNPQDKVVGFLIYDQDMLHLDDLATQLDMCILDEEEEIEDNNEKEYH